MGEISRRRKEDKRRWWEVNIIQVCEYENVMKKFTILYN
jgi:hypothetical protein